MNLKEAKKRKRMEDVRFLLVCLVKYAESIGFRGEAVFEYKFHPGRRWRSDLALLGENGIDVLIEVEGGSWSGGAHVRGAHFGSDLEKYNTATAAGFRVLRYRPEDLERMTIKTTAQIRAAITTIRLWETPEFNGPGIEARADLFRATSVPDPKKKRAGLTTAGGPCNIGREGDIKR